MMAIKTIDELPLSIVLSGGELVWVYAATGLAEPLPQWVGQQCTTAQIAALAAGVPVTGACTMRQLIAALAADGYLVTLFDALPGDITDQYNIAYWHAARMTIADPFVTLFLQPTLGLSGVQLTALFAQALTFPP